MSKVLYFSIIKAGGIVEKGFNKNTSNSAKVNEDVLFNILNRNKNCELGLKYKFKSIRTIDEFKKLVPLSNYSNYEEYIKRMENGEQNVLVSEVVEYFGHTSGTTGKQKLIPVTKSSRSAASKYMAILTQKFAYNKFKNKWNYGKGLMIADVVMTTYTEGGIPICSATSGGMKSIKPFLPYLYTSPYEVMEIKDKDSGLYLHLLFGLEEVNLQYISGVFISNILDLLRMLEDKSKTLVRDIRRGSIDRNLKLDDKYRTILNSYLTPNASRADELELQFSKGFKGICKRIWPKFAYIASVTGANFSIYDEKVNYYTDNIPIYSPGYAATEGMIGINPYVDKIKYVIVPDTVFYEFIPIDENNNNNYYYNKTYNINELVIGSKYEIVITNNAGLYRYRLGDVVKVVGYYNNSPEVEFLYRKNQVLNMVSEKTTEDHLKTSISNTMKKLDLFLVDYTTLADNSVTPGRYIFYFEFKDNISKYNLKSMEKLLDEELQKSNLAYGRFRKNNKLSNVKIILVKYKTFDTIKNSLLLTGISKNQIKIPRVVTTNKYILTLLNKNKLNI